MKEKIASVASRFLSSPYPLFVPAICTIVPLLVPGECCPVPLCFLAKLTHSGHKKMRIAEVVHPPPLPFWCLVKRTLASFINVIMFIAHLDNAYPSLFVLIHSYNFLISRTTYMAARHQPCRGSAGIRIPGLPRHASLPTLPLPSSSRSNVTALHPPLVLLSCCCGGPSATLVHRRFIISQLPFSWI
jgi:hypothetical protein